MPLSPLVAVRCKLAPGMFSSERVFTITLADNSEYRGVSPHHFCWNQDGVLVSQQEPSQEIEGSVAARVVDELDEHQLAVEVPDGEVIAVNRNSVINRPTEIRPPTAPISTESGSDVPIRP